MRTLTSTLLTAQVAASMLPHVRLTIYPPVPDWTRLYTGSEPDSFHAVAIPADGSLIRARSTGGNLYVQRVTTPGPGSTYSNWTTLETGISTISGIALFAKGSRVLLFFTASDQITIKCRESTDNGASWGAAVTAVTSAANVNHIAAAENDSTVVALFHFAADGYIYSTKRTSGTWGAATQWANGYIGCTGIATHYSGDFNLIITGGRTSEGKTLWQTILGDGYSYSVGTWGPLVTLDVAETGMNVEFHYPSLVMADLYRMTFEERFLGTGSYNRPFQSYQPSGNEFVNPYWCEPQPINLATTFGVALALSGDYLWMTTPSGVWRKYITAPAGTAVTADILQLTETREEFAGKLDFILRNPTGTYGSPAGTLPTDIKRGSTVQLDLGYTTTSGNEHITAQTYHVASISHQSKPGRVAMAITAVDPWRILASTRARRQMVWAADTTIQSIITQLFARVGMTTTIIGASARIAALQPHFTINPGQDYRTAVLRLLASVTDRIVFRGDGAYIVNPEPGDDTAYTYGPSHQIHSGEYTDQNQADNWATVRGLNAYGEDMAWTSIADTGPRLSIAYDNNLTGATPAHERAEAIIQSQALDMRSGQITVPTNVGQELYDVISISDPRTGGDAISRRVKGIVNTFNRETRAEYISKILLGGM